MRYNDLLLHAAALHRPRPAWLRTALTRVLHGWLSTGVPTGRGESDVLRVVW